MSKLTDQPSYKRFREIVRQNTGSVVAWVGSGPSISAGVPSWVRLKKILIEELQKKAELYSENAEKAKLRAAAELATAEPNLWVAFDILQNNLGDASFRSSIASQFSVANTCVLPNAYKLLWRMRLGGVLTLNIDKLVSRAFSEERQGTAITEFTGRQIADFQIVLKSTLPFIGHLHGKSDDSKSWVFTKADLRALQSTPGYIDFINSCFIARTIVFIGISADDLAAGGYLEQLAQRGISSGTHFWITHRRDAATDDWAEKIGIQLIRYENFGNDHSQLQTLLEDLQAYIPPEIEAAPVIGAKAIISSIPANIAPNELIKYDTADKRKFIAARAIEILSSSNPTKYIEYEAFVKNYDEAIHHAWYATTDEGHNDLFGYTLTSEIATGSFGEVFTAIDSNGQTVAIKILHQQVRNKKGWLQSFRRGVAAMRILTNHSVPGVVRFIDAGEIPAFAVMEYVQGPSLQTMVDTNLIQRWDTVIRIANELSQIIKSAHNLTEHVLHRDIRPSNVVIRGGWDDIESEWKTVVLDFDLAWHKEAVEMSISAPGNGYLAPEQVHKESGITTRNALVDSYGLGMTLFFVRTRTEPTFNQPAHDDWAATLARSARDVPFADWKSLPNRFFRLIEEATRPHQPDRWDMTQIVSELLRLQDAMNNPNDVRSAELLAEELGARAFSSAYRWDRANLKAVGELPFEFSIQGSETLRQLQAKVNWVHTGTESFKKIGKWLPEASQRIAAAFRRSDWDVKVSSANLQLEVVATIQTVNASMRFQDSVNSIEEVLEIVSRL